MSRKPRATVSLSAIAELLGVSTRQIQNYRAEGMPVRQTSGKISYVPRECIRWRIERERDSALAATAPLEPLERARKLRAEADLKELELKERRRALVPVEEFQARIDALVGGLVAVASGRLQRFEREIVAATTPAAARKITERIHDALFEGARAFADELEAEADALADTEETAA